MGSDAINGVVTVITMVVVVAIVAVVVSQNSQTGSVLTAGGAALSNAIKAAVSPVSTTTTNTQLGH